MRKLFCFLFLCFITNILVSQSLKKYPINQSGCAAYFFCNPGTFTESYSIDSSIVYTGECINDEVGYGIICVKLASTIDDLTTAEEMLVSYLDFLKASFKIKNAVGYGRGHRLKGREDTRGIIDYWSDENNINWKIKGWTDGRFIAMLYVKSIKEVPVSKENLFLDGLVLPVK